MRLTHSWTRGLRALLDRHGELHVMGSHALGLMTWRDLDLHLVRPASDITAFFTLGGDAQEKPRPAKRVVLGNLSWQ